MRSHHYIYWRYSFIPFLLYFSLISCQIVDPTSSPATPAPAMAFVKKDSWKQYPYRPKSGTYPTKSPSGGHHKEPTRSPLSRHPTYSPTFCPSSLPSYAPTHEPTFLITDPNPKNIILIIADDLGWDDVSFHGNSQIPTPSIDSLANNGVILDRFYVQSVCSPTRAALLTGRSSTHTSLFDNTFLPLKPNFTMLPSHLNRLGYSCHLVGKWHLGDLSWGDTPLYKGFETHFGILGGSGDHYLHNYEEQGLYDFWDQKEPRFDLACNKGNNCSDSYYSTHLFADRAISIIDQSVNQRSPLYLQIAFTAPHYPLEAPQRIIDLFTDTIEHPDRRVYAAMIYLLDEAIKNITLALDRNGMRENTVIVFMSDNGAMVDLNSDGFGGGIGSNWPLRGTKRTLFEGGVRVPAFISGGGISGGRILTGLLHVTDWFPTLLTMAARQVNPSWDWKSVVFFGDGEPPFAMGDGIDQWDYITGLAASTKRIEVILETHELGGHWGTGNALIVGSHKILIRTSVHWPASTNIFSNDGWFGGPHSSDPYLGAYALPRGTTSQPYTVQCPRPPIDHISSYQCENKLGNQLDDMSYACLFNIYEDPCEQVDLSLTRPDILLGLWNRLAHYRKDVYEYHCTRCGGGYPCPQQETYLHCNPMWEDVMETCHVYMPC